LFSFTPTFIEPSDKYRISSKEETNWCIIQKAAFRTLFLGGGGRESMKVKSPNEKNSNFSWDLKNKYLKFKLAKEYEYRNTYSCVSRGDRGGACP